MIADEAHRSQYDFIDGLARHMRDALPHAAFTGFTGTPIEPADANHAGGVRRLPQRLRHPAGGRGRRDGAALLREPAFEEATEGEAVERTERLKTTWAPLEAVVGAAKRLALVARALVEHFERRREALDGKAMVVCMSRCLCVELSRERVHPRPAWADEDDARGAITVVMTGAAADPPDRPPHLPAPPALCCSDGCGPISPCPACRIRRGLAA